MGQAQSRRVSTSSTSSQTPLNPTIGADKVYQAFYSDANPLFANTFSAGPEDSNVTRPAPPQRTYRISELIDPYELLGLAADDCIRSPPPVNPARSGPLNMNKQLPMLVEDPSGRTIAPQEFLAYPDRPLAIRERQEMIRQAMERANSGTGSLGSRPRNSRKGSAGTTASRATNSTRKGSSGSRATSSERKGSAGTMEEKGSRWGEKGNTSAKVEEGRVAWQEKEMKKKEGRSGCGVFGGCFGKA